MFLVSNHIGILILLSFHTSVSLAANHFVTAPPLIPSDVNAVSRGSHVCPVCRTLMHARFVILSSLEVARSRTVYFGCHATLSLAPIPQLFSALPFSTFFLA